MHESTKRPPRGSSLLRDSRGLTTVEYIIILCLIAVAGFGAWNAFGSTVSEKISGVTGTIGDLPTGSGGAAKGPRGSLEGMGRGLMGQAASSATRGASEWVHPNTQPATTSTWVNPDER